MCWVLGLDVFVGSLYVSSSMIGQVEPSDWCEDEQTEADEALGVL